MVEDDALAALAALSHPVRLDAFRRLVHEEPDGLTTGQLVAASGLSQSTLSTHLAVLVKAGLVQSTKRGRNHVQRANLDALQSLTAFLIEDCCGGHPERCPPLPAGRSCS